MLTIVHTYINGGPSYGVISIDPEHEVFLGCDLRKMQIRIIGTGVEKREPVFVSCVFIDCEFGDTPLDTGLFEGCDFQVTPLELAPKEPA